MFYLLKSGAELDFSASFCHLLKHAHVDETMLNEIIKLTKTKTKES